MLAHVCDEARRLGAGKLVGRLLITAKNEPARDLYARHGFVKLQEFARESLWEMDLMGGGIAWPDWFHVVRS